KKQLDLAFFDYGLNVCNFLVQSITLPDELQKYLDKQSASNLVGDLRKYATFQAADSISVAAENPGGLASAGVGLGAGAAIGQTFAQSLGQATGQPAVEQGDPFQLLEKLQGLLSKGIISQEEFDQKKSEILKRL